MDTGAIAQSISELTPEGQQQVADFVAFLRHRQPSPKRKADSNAKPLSDEPFVGMWIDRADMADSSDWVRCARRSEWRHAGG